MTIPVIHRIPANDPNFNYLRQSIGPVLPIMDNLRVVFDGPTGGGKTAGAVYTCIVNGQLRDKIVYSNVPFAYYVYDAKQTKYEVHSLELNILDFVKADAKLYGSWVLIDEGNYEADRLRSVSTKNMSIMDIIQQSRKMRMSVAFTTVNFNWLDPRFTGSLLDVRINCQDTFFTPWGRENHINKGERTIWDAYDMSGKLTGTVYRAMGKRTFFNRGVWNIYDTEYFVNPLEARRKINFNEAAMVFNEDGESVPLKEWEDSFLYRAKVFAEQKGHQNSRDMFRDMGIDSLSLRQRAGRVLQRMGVPHKLQTDGSKVYDLSPLLESK